MSPAQPALESQPRKVFFLTNFNNFSLGVHIKMFLNHKFKLVIFYS
ncbi:hypothetical protein AAJ76_1270003768 [Vairimorpha ceranae]|uniref:Uncharacterized protein n=1 Tax=Vairimorpha ceranae TaxID=40302 RepID=A0A0F9WAV2_9MICR|nr:hypothetical protein AAJ76_1270003768 [Vairimorpha ceranae]KKO74055.1 hypothetical protein AAJ76_1270003768 [Vairimorpha ceranae]